VRLQSEKSKAERKRDEWVGAVDRLKVRIQNWLAEDDPRQLLQIGRLPFHLRERGIGSYRIDGLSIGLGPREVRLEPVARNVAGSVATTGAISMPRAFGRVDLTNGLEKYLIFRDAVEPEDRWRILDEDRHEARPFDRQSFEDALRDLLG
jgi:hypothetical protein